MNNHGPAAPPEPIRVMLVDDSAVVRGFIARILEGDPDIQIVASVANGEQGISSAKRYHPDIVILDVEMPVMDGITALPKILAASPGVRVLMCSTLTLRNAEITMKALQLGATDTIAKPSNAVDIRGATDFKTEILRVVKTLGRRVAGGPVSTAAPASKSSLATGLSLPAHASGIAPSQARQFLGGANAPIKSKTAFDLRTHAPGEMFKPNLLAIGSSTGGPQALFAAIGHFKNFHVPIVVTQHMPATFTKILAQHIAMHTGVQTFEGENGMKVEPGTVYVAPGGYHMMFERSGTHNLIRLNDGPQENFCRPSVDPMLRSAIDVWGPKFLAVILTGMGQDGLAGCRKLVELGGRVIAQDQETSVVWGMPGAVATAGICTDVLPLPDIGPAVKKIFGKF